ncbi:MAG: response regulator transcription factor [Bacteroidales bacterium]|nr:response regulator transcription factor [Bacteroidales bacterium]
MKLLIADDSSLMRERIKNQVKDFDQVTIVGEADNGRTAMEMIRKFEPDLVILDLHMPEIGGMEVLKKIKDDKMKTKVCILTNYSYPHYKTKCLALGADYFLSKSDDFEKTNSVVADILLTL